MMRVLVIGHSHLLALQEAYLDCMPPQASDWGDSKFDFIRLLRSEPVQQVRAQIADQDYDLVLSALGGNGHNVFGLANHPVPFDFVLPEEADLPLSAGAEILPMAVVATCLRGPNAYAFSDLRDLRAATAARIIHIESPPPLPGEYVVRFPGNYEHMLAGRGVAPELLRYKLWRLNSMLFREFCAQSGIEFLPSPAETQDQNGMLVEAAWNLDPTHGNYWYGSRVLHQVAELIRPGIPQ